MWWVGNKRLDIYIGSHGFMTELEGQVSTLAIDGFEAAVAALQCWIGEHPGRYSVYIWLSGGLCRPFVMPAATGASNAEERMAVMQALGSEATGLALSDPMACTVQMSDNLGVVVENAVIDALKSVLVPYRAKSIQPWWACALNAQLAQTPELDAFAVHDCDSLTLLFGTAGGFSHASTIFPIETAEAASGAWGRALMAQDHDIKQPAFIRLKTVAGSSGAPTSQPTRIPFASQMEALR